MARKIAWMLVALVLGLGVFGMVSAQAKGPPQPTGVTYLDHTVRSGFSDLGKHGFSAGDEFFFHDVLKQSGTKKGTIDGYCKVIQLKPVGTAVCTTCRAQSMRTTASPTRKSMSCSRYQAGVSSNK